MIIHVVLKVYFQDCMTYSHERVTCFEMADRTTHNGPPLSRYKHASQFVSTVRQPPENREQHIV